MLLPEHWLQREGEKKESSGLVVCLSGRVSLSAYMEHVRRTRQPPPTRKSLLLLLLRRTHILPLHDRYLLVGLCLSVWLSVSLTAPRLCLI